MNIDEFEPKEEIVNHGCETCLYEHLSECEEPCAHCTFNFEPSSVMYNKAKDCYVRKYESSNCTISCKECNDWLDNIYKLEMEQHE